MDDWFLWSTGSITTILHTYYFLVLLVSASGTQRYHIDRDMEEFHNSKVHTWQTITIHGPSRLHSDLSISETSWGWF